MKVHKVRNGLFFLLAVVVLLLPLAGVAQGDGFYTVSQGETRVPIRPLESAQDAVAFYDFLNTQSNTGYEEANTAVFFLYRNTGSGEISLFVLLNGEPAGSAGAVQLTVSGVPADAGWIVQDDSFDFRDSWTLDPPSAEISWTWDEGRGDGMVLGPLGTEFELSLFPTYTSGITRAKILHGSATDPSELELNLRDPFTIGAATNEPPSVSVVSSPVEPRINEPVRLDASESFDADGRIVSYEWDFNGDGNYDQSTTDPVVTTTFSTPGVRTITVRGTDDEGASGRASITVNVSDLAVQVTRTISTAQALPGSTFLVVVRIEPQMDLAGVGLKENLPIGWSVKPLESGGAAFKRSTVEWVFVDKIRANTTKVISYELTVPESRELIATTLPVCFTITGELQSMSPGFDLPVEGDSEVEVTDALSLKTAIAHLVPRLGPGGDDTIDLRLSQIIEQRQLTRALEMWQYGESVRWTQGATISLHMMKELSAYAYTCTPVDLPLPAVGQANITAVRTINTPVPCNNVLLNYHGPGGDKAASTFTVKVEIWADQDLYGVGLEEDLPTGWKVIPVDNGGFLFKASKTEWVFPSKVPAGQMKTIIYQVEVPQSTSLDLAASDPCYASSNDLYGLVDAALPCMEVVVTGDRGVDVSSCVSVLVAISRWDVVNDVLDITLSDKISFQQVQRAIAFWLEDEIVPRTCDQTVGYHMLKEIIAYWLTNANVCDPLPDFPQGPCDPGTSTCDG
jgi:PKD repeat protein